MTNLNIEILVAIFWIVIVVIAISWIYQTYRSNAQAQDNYYERALKATVEENHRKAVEFFKEAIRQNTANVDAYVKLGDILRKEGAYSQAYKVHKDLVLRSDLSSEDRVNVLTSLASDLIVLKKEDKARPMLEQVAKIQPGHPVAIRELVKLYEKTESFRLAFQVLKNADAEVIEDQSIRMAMYKVLDGLELVDQGKERDARISFKDALKYESQCEAAMILIGDSYWREDRKEEAIEKWVECAQVIPEKAHFVFDRLEKAWFETGEFYKLEEFYRNLLGKKRMNMRAVLALAEILYKKGESEEAMQLCNDYIRKYPEDEVVQAYLLSITIDRRNPTDIQKKMLKFLNDTYLSRLELYTCQSCGNQEDEPLGKCRVCGKWGKYV